MVLRLAKDEVLEVRKALSVAHQQVLLELSRGAGCLGLKPGLELCQRKWSLEALLHQLEHPDHPRSILELAPASSHDPLRREAA